jgi:hypothetical protein
MLLKCKFSLSSNYKYIVPCKYKSTLLWKYQLLMSCVHKYILFKYV